MIEHVGKRGLEPQTIVFLERKLLRKACVNIDLPGTLQYAQAATPEAPCVDRRNGKGTNSVIILRRSVRRNWIAYTIGPEPRHLLDISHCSGQYSIDPGLDSSWASATDRSAAAVTVLKFQFPRIPFSNLPPPLQRTSRVRKAIDNYPSARKRCRGVPTTLPLSYRRLKRLAISTA